MQSKNDNKMIGDIYSAPVVSICCVTYNHENYLKQCLDGFVKQQTNFSFEILVHEDASTDNTAIILREYEASYPHLFRCVYQTENQFLKQNTLTNILIPMARGKYIALCEGDDYWIDPYKLQKQVDFLEGHTDYVLCCGYVETLIEGSKEVKKLSSDKIVAKTFVLTEVMIENRFNTLTVVFRNNFSFNTYVDVMQKTPIGDWLIYIIAGINNRGGKYFVMPEVMGVYRIHSGGLYSKLPKKEAELKLIYTGELINQLTNKEFNYLFLVNSFILNEGELQETELLQHIIDEIELSTLDKDIKERLVIYLKTANNAPYKVLLASNKSEELLAISGFLLAASYVSAKGSLVSFAKSLDRILKTLSNLHPENEGLIIKYVHRMWHMLYVFFDYNFLSFLLISTNRCLFNNKAKLMDWLYINKLKFPLLARLSLLSKRDTNLV